MKTNVWIRPALLAVLVSSLLGCGGSGGGGESSDATGLAVAMPPDTAGSLFGRIVTRGSEVPLPGVTVRASGQSVTTGPDGSYLLSQLPLGRTLVTLAAPGHADDAFVADLNASLGRQRIGRQLHAVGQRLSFDPATAQLLQDPRSTARVSLPANALVGAEGAAPVGPVTMDVTLNDPGPDSDPTALPGDGQAATGAVQFFGAATYTFHDANGRPLNLAAGRSASIRIPAATSPTTLPATASLHHFDPSSGRWVQEGQASRVGAGVGAYFEGTVTHFSTWAAAAPHDRISLTGRVVDEFGLPMPGVRVFAVGVDHIGSGQTTADASGHFSVFAKPSARLVVFAVSNDGESPELPVTTTSASAELPAALVLPALSRARLALGAPTVGLSSSTCCSVSDVRASFAVTGVSPTRVRVLSARWELGHNVPQTCVGTATGYACTGPGTLATERWLVHLNPADRGGYLSMQIAGRPGELTGTLGFQASVHFQSSDEPLTAVPLGNGSPGVTFSVVLVLDLQDAATGTVLTVRSQPVIVSAG